mgnify:CR=1 FL=1
MIDRKYVPDILTSLRIVGAVALVIVAPLTPLFYFIYTVCGITDGLDGWLARRWGCTSMLGAALDSVADLLFYTVTVLRLMPVLAARLPSAFWLAVAAVLAVRLAAYAVAAVKYRRFAAMHTYGNKITGFSLFMLPYLMGMGHVMGPCTIVCALGGLSSAEELAIHLMSPVYDPTVKAAIMLRHGMKRP